jgi:outer membrane protein assembly factor BamB
MEPEKLQRKWVDTFGIAFVILAMLLVSGCQGPTSTTPATTNTTLTTLATTAVTSTGKIDVLTYHYDNLRDGVDPDETILTPQNVNSNSFGKLFSVPVDGDVYAQPLYVSDLLMPDGKIHDVMFVVTEHDSLYAIDANNGTILWQDSFIDPNNGIVPVPSADTRTEDITPEVGITGTPVIDATTSTIYFVSNVKNTNNDTYAQYLDAIDLVTGKEKFNGPELISASVENADGTTISFDPLLGNQRSALLLLDGTVYIAWASHGDNGDYHGWIMSYSAQAVSQQLGVLITTLNGSEGGVWMAGGGLSSDGTYIFAGVANGILRWALGDLYTLLGKNLPLAFE